MAGRPWTLREDSTLVRLYGSMLAREVAVKLKRSLSAVYLRADFLGLMRKRDKAGIQRKCKLIRQYHAKGWSQSEIAAKVGLTRRSVGHWLVKMGLKSNDRNERYRKRVAATTRKQCREAGVRNLAELRSERLKQFAAEVGWPGVSVRSAQIASILHANGPMTRRQIAAAIGMKWKGSRKTLQNNRVPGQSYMAELQQAGYVVCLRRAKSNSGKGRNEDIYFIALEAEPCRKEAQ